MKLCLPCISDCCFDRGFFLKVRKFSFKIVTHTVFEYMVIFCILLSSVALVSTRAISLGQTRWQSAKRLCCSQAMDDIYLQKRIVIRQILKVAEIFFCIFFAGEMLLKWIGFGWKKYFTDYWCLLDCALVLVRQNPFQAMTFNL